MRKLVRWSLVLTLVAALLAVGGMSCSSGEEELQTYKVGAVFSVTGPYSPLGEPEKQTVEMMVAEINAAGGINGHTLEVIVYDDESDTTKAVTMATRLVEQDNVLAILGPTATGTSMAVVPVATNGEVPLIDCAASEPIVNDEQGNEREWVFMTPQSSNQAARILYRYLTDNLGVSNVAVITDKGGFGQLGKAALDKEVSAFDLSIVAAETFDNANDKDMSPQLLNLMNASPAPEAIICWGTNPGPAIITKNKADLGIEIPLLQSHGSLSKTFLDLAGDAAEGVVLASGKFWVAGQLPDSDPQKAVILDYIADFEGKYGEGKANTYGGHAYDALSMVVMALEEMDEGLTVAEAREFIRDYVQTISGFAGTGGVFNMSPDDHHGLTDDAMVLVKVVNEEFTAYQP